MSKSHATSHSKDVLLARIAELEAALHSETKRNKRLQSENSWLRRQVFGQKSERRAYVSCDKQLWLGEQFQEDSKPPPQERSVKAHTRRKWGKKKNACGDISRLKFDERARVITINVPDPVVEEGLELEEIRTESTYRLAQVQGPYVVLRYLNKVFKVKETGKIVASSAPAAVVERSFADVSFLAGMAVDKTVYHLPLHRQHQRIQASGIDVSRPTLSHCYHRIGELLEPIYLAILSNILLSSTIYVDQTHTKAERAKGKMVPASYWGVMNRDKEVAFVFSPSRSGKFIGELLKDYSGTIITDGEPDYAKFGELSPRITHALCWVHVRRYFIKAEAEEPEIVGRVLSLIGRLYRIEGRIRGVPPEYREQIRKKWSKRVVDRFFAYIKEVVSTHALLPSQALMKAVNYAQKREAGLRIFLSDQMVAPDTNELERMFRPHAVGRKNWMFHVTKQGARCTGIIYSLVQTCRLNGIDPYHYLVDVLQRIDSHPVRDVHLLTPVNWKKSFQENLFTSDIQTL